MPQSVTIESLPEAYAVIKEMGLVDLPVVGVIPVQAIQALPFVVTVLVLAGFVGKSIPPRASGLPYVKER